MIRLGHEANKLQTADYNHARSVHDTMPTYLFIFYSDFMFRWMYYVHKTDINNGRLKRESPKLQN